MRITAFARFTGLCVAPRQWQQVWSKANGWLRNWMNAVANKQDYIARLQVAASHLHNCGTIHRGSVLMHEVFKDQTVWQGEAEVLDLHNPLRPNVLTPGAIWMVKRMIGSSWLPFWRLRRWIRRKRLCRFKS